MWGDPYPFPEDTVTVALAVGLVNRLDIMLKTAPVGGTARRMH